MRISSQIISFPRFSGLRGYGRLFLDWKKFKAAGGFARVIDLWPCLFDRTSVTQIDAHYFYQAVWAFKQILSQRPRAHVDLGSQVNLVGLLTTVTHVTFLDIRPLVLTLNDYTGLGGSITALPFRNDAVASLSSLHVIEHIGLGRYGDPIDPEGSLKAAREIVRVLAPGGRAYISVPIGRPRVQFNGQRVFAPTDVVTMFDGLDLVEMAMVDASGKFHGEVKPESADIGEAGQGSDFGLGLFCFQKQMS
jgi:SAM-dependent methyltransferase